VIPIATPVANFVRGFADRNVDLVISVITPDFHYVDPFTSLIGPQRMARFCAASFARFDRLEMEFVTAAASGECFAFEWLYTLRTRPGNAPSRLVTFSGGAFTRIVEGKLEHWHDYWDGQSVLAQFGVGSFAEL
jgi:limonene-1,2-epoxide hydrolase